MSQSEFFCENSAVAVFRKWSDGFVNCVMADIFNFEDRSECNQFQS